MTRVIDIMTREVATIGPDGSLPDVIALIMQHKIAGLPVVAPNGELVGVISEVDILRRLFPDYNEFIGDIDGAMEFDFTDLKLDHLRTLRVNDVMHSNPISVSPSENVMKACGLMVSHKIRRLPVVDPATNRLVGIVSQGQVFQEILRLAAAHA